MSLTRQFLAPIAIQDRQNNVISVDLSAFLLRLFLFDTYILQSVWLDDLELLINVFGVEGLTLLFQEGALKLYCESYTIGETGRARADLNFSGNNKRLPLGSYAYSVLRVQDQEARLRKKIQWFAASPSLPPARVYFADEVEKNLIPMPNSFSGTVFEGFYSDLRRGEDVVRTALELQLRRQGIKPKRLRAAIEEIESEDFRLDTNMQVEYGFSERAAHRIGDQALMAIANLNWKLAVMQTHSTLVGINDADQPLLRGKLALVAELANAHSQQEGQFNRVLSLVDLPVARYGGTRLNAEKILRLRQSDSCRAFRDWLTDSHDLSDREIESRLAGFRSTLKAALNSTYGRTIRFLVSNGLQAAIGASAGAEAGIAAGALVAAVDSFVLEWLSPKDAIVSFLGDEYPSVFERN